jgi:uncharacterized protein YutE (UPF0331/DUF86 family)
MARYDDQVIKTRLARIARAVEQIERDRPATIEGLAGPDGELRLAGLQYWLVVALQAAIDVATHLCVAEGFGAPGTYRDAIEELARRGVLPGNLAERLAKAVGLRNVLIHEYLEVDSRRVFNALGEVDDLKRFASAVWEHIGG